MTISRSVLFTLSLVILHVGISESSTCPQSIPTVAVVTRCPSNAKEWVTAAKRKSCTEIGKVQTCTDADRFVYHCILNEEGTSLLEVCAPIWFLSGFCARFSEVDQRIINDPGLDCSKFDPPCPTRFPSNESYKYQTCYQGVDKSNNEKDESNLIIAYVFLAILGITTVVLSILLVWNFKLKRSTSTEDTRTEDAECTLLEDTIKEDAVCTLLGTQTTDENERPEQTESQTVKYKSLSGKEKGSVSVKDVRTLDELLKEIAEDVFIDRQFLCAVDMQTGQILDANRNIKTHPLKCIELMIKNQRRNEGIRRQYTDGVQNDVIKNEKLTGVKCKMSCGHFTAPDSLFNFVIREFVGAASTSLQCPDCKDERVWRVDELIENCNMSSDEQMFFKRVAELNRINEEEVRKGKELLRQQESSASPKRFQP